MDREHRDQAYQNPHDHVEASHHDDPMYDSTKHYDDEVNLREQESFRTERPAASATTGNLMGGSFGDGSYAPLFSGNEAERFRSHWMEIQTGFVDDPRVAVEQADHLVKELTEQLNAVFTRNRDEMERRWKAGENVSTEDLRQALQQYRSFFERLLSF